MSSSTIKPEYLKENFEALQVQLTGEEVKSIRELVEKASVFGERWPKEHALGLFADTPDWEGWQEPEKVDVGVIGKIMFDSEEKL